MTVESELKWLLRFIGITTIPAFVTGIMPQSWLAFLIHKAEPEMPIGILVTYLARVLMLMYAFVGLQCFIIAADIRRYLPLLWVMGVGSIAATIAGLVALFVTVAPDHRTGLFWIVFGDFTEGLVQGVVLVVLLCRVARPLPRQAN